MNERQPPAARGGLLALDDTVTALSELRTEGLEAGSADIEGIKDVPELPAEQASIRQGFQTDADTTEHGGRGGRRNPHRDVTPRPGTAGDDHDVPDASHARQLLAFTGAGARHAAILPHRCRACPGGAPSSGS